MSTNSGPVVGLMIFFGGSALEAGVGESGVGPTGPLVFVRSGGGPNSKSPDSGILVSVGNVGVCVPRRGPISPDAGAARHSLVIEFGDVDTGRSLTTLDGRFFSCSLRSKPT